MSLKDKCRRLKYKIKHDFLSVENVVLGVAIVMCLVWTYQAVLAMSRNWTQSQKISEEEKRLSLLKMEVEAAELENAYYQTDEYKELAARKFADKKLPGENLVVLPENSKEAKAKDVEINVVERGVEYSNFEKWMMFLFPNY
ncbi:MAG: hypothetical protein Q4A79_00320 [Candidatus Saccharibacteria bacterium]|nr:hypothetical protein [Candidatus Saccharibacteria bacterium]